MNNNKFCTIYLVRHGETEGNLKKMYIGHIDSPLTDNGILDLKKFAQELKDIHFDAVFSSDLLRAKRSAQILLLERKLEIITAKNLREKYFGALEGKTADEFKKQFSVLIQAYERLSDKEKKTFKYVSDMETDEQAVSRVLTFLREIATAYLGKTVLVVSHGSIMRSLLIHLGFGNYKELYPGKIKNGAYIKLLSEGIEFFIKETVRIEKNT